MALSNVQYDELMDEYEKIRRKNSEINERRIQEISESDPEFNNIMGEMGSLSYKAAKFALKHHGDEDTGFFSSYTGEMDALKKRLGELLKKHSKPEDWLDPVYDCHLCHDTGITPDLKNCQCFTKKSIELIYRDSNLKNIIAGHTFDNFELSLYPDDMTDPVTGRSSRDLAEYAYNIALKYADEFDNIPSDAAPGTGNGKSDGIRRNLLITGSTGLGKTFLSTCIAERLISTAHSVIYLTAENYFARMDTNDEHSPLLECDLLIIDDLGTEYNNAYTSALIFHGINERLLRDKHTIISTNLDLEQIRDRYTDRVLSRIYRNFTMIRLFGDDIRMK